jgi:signal transduction histidine kinase
MSKEAYQDIEQVSTRIGTTIDSLRYFCNELRPDLLDRFGLIDAIELFTAEIEKRTGTSCRIDVSGNLPNIPADIQIALFRIIQEAVNNIRRHAKANKIEVAIKFSDDSIEIAIKDNGIGFEMPDFIGDSASRGKLGVVGMNERAHLIGGNFNVDSQVGKGTIISVRVPISNAE